MSFLLQCYFGIGAVSMVIAWGWSRAYWLGEYDRVGNGIAFGLIYGFLSLLAWPMVIPALYFILTDRACYGWRL